MFTQSTKKIIKITLIVISSKIRQCKQLGTSTTYKYKKKKIRAHVLMFLDMVKLIRYCIKRLAGNKKSHSMIVRERLLRRVL